MTPPMFQAIRAPLSSRALLVDLVRKHESISRVELTEVTDLKAPTVSSAVKRLIDEGLVAESGRGASTGGKPRTLLQLRREARYVIGAHLSFTSSTLVMLDFAGNLVSRIRRPWAPFGPDPVASIASWAELIDDLIRRADVPLSRIVGVGAVCPGPLRQDDGLLSAPPDLAAWVGLPLRAMIEEAVGLPVILDNDASAAAAGTTVLDEHDASSGAVLFMSDGIGGGFRHLGEVFGGSQGNACEVGHVCIDPDGPPCWCGADGCLEALAGPGVVIERARTAGLIREDPEGSTQTRFAEVARLALRGNPAAAAIIEDSARWMALGAQALVALLDPRVLVLSGPGFAVAGPLYLGEISRRIGLSAFGRLSDVEIIMDETGHDAAATGAAKILLRSDAALI